MHFFKKTWRDNDNIICDVYAIIIIREMGILYDYCLGLGHEIIVCIVCFAMM